MATGPIPLLSWACPQCGQQVPAGQATCPNQNCAGVGAPPPSAPRPPRPAPAPPAPPPPPPAQPPVPAPVPQPQRVAPVAPPPAPQAHGGNLQYRQRLTGVSVNRNENLINHNWYRFLLWMLRIGGAAALLWLFYGGFLLGWHANPCKPPCTAVVAATVPTSVSASLPVPPAVSIAVSQPAAPAPPPLDLSPVERGLNRIADELSRPVTAEPARVNPHPVPQELDEATARWLENRQL
jgi:hypothetical protein